MGAAAYSAVGLIAGCMVASMVLVGWSMYREYSRNRKSTVKYSAHERDLANVNTRVCVCCGGYATRVTARASREGETVYVCLDRKLCRATMAFKSELDSMA